jgi:CRP-like cAMP-binding protein
MLKHPIPVKEFVGSLPLFKGLDCGAIARLTAHISALDIPKGAVFVRRGEPCLGMHIVVYGHVKLSLQAPKGDEKVVRAARGAVRGFGEAPMFSRRALSLYCRMPERQQSPAFCRSRVVLAELGCDPTFARRIISSLSQRLGRLINDLEGCTLRSGTQRVISYLLSQLAESTKSENAITFPAQKSVIASHLNLTHEHFSRILHDLVAGGMIEVRGPVVRILDAAQLRSRAA